MRPKTPSEWGIIFTDKHNLYSRFTEKLKSLVYSLLEENNIKIAQLECRTKTVDSFVKKIERKDYPNPLEEITDLTGVRIITFYIDDIDIIEKLIINEFDVDNEQSVDKAQVLDPDRFGYLSKHYIISLSYPRNTLQEWKQFNNLKAELQVRTVLQHAWGAISRKLAYNSPDEVPKKLRRKLFRLSALLELADEEFLELKNITGQLEEIYSDEIKSGGMDTDINLISLEIYFNSTQQLRIWGDIAKKAGFDVIDIYKIDINNNNYATSLQRIIKILNLMGINKVKELDDMLDSKVDSRINALNNYYIESRGKITTIIPPLTIVILLLTYLIKDKLTDEQLIGLGFSQKALSIIKNIT